MGKKKLAIIDDSQPKVEEKQKKPSTHPSFGGKKVKENEGRLTPNAVSSRVAEGDRTRGDEPQGVNTEGVVSGQESGSADRSEKKEPDSVRVDEPTTQQKKLQKPGKAKPRSKKYQELVKDLDRSKTYPIPKAVDMVKKLNYAKFNATIEAHINTIQTGIRGLVSLPFSVGKKLKIVAFGKGAEASGADVAGTDETIEEINKGKVNFDLVITTAEWMSKLAKVAKILGPRGLMPNPKNGTITDDLKKAVEGFQAGKTEYKTESKAPVIHLGLGKLDQPTEQLSQNVKTLLQTVGKTRIKKVMLSPTMGPSVKVDLSSI